MVVFGVSYKPEIGLVDFVREINKNLKSNDLKKNPFNGSVKFHPEYDILIFNMKPVVFFDLSIFRRFFFFVFKLGARKKGVKCKLKLVSNSDLLERLFEVC